MPSIDEVVVELRQEKAPVGLADRLLQHRRPRKVIPVRLATVGFLLLSIVFVLPFVTTRAEARSMSEVARQSGKAQFLIVRSFRLVKGRKVLDSEQLFAPRARVERVFFNSLSMRETRRVPGIVFERYVFRNEDGFLPYETLAKSEEPVFGTDSTRVSEELLALVRKNGMLQDRAEGALVDGLIRLKGKGCVAWIERDSDRLRKLETEGGLITEIEYPLSLEENRIGIPPVGWSWANDAEWLSLDVIQRLSRFNLDAERNEFWGLVSRSKALVGAFQSVTDPGAPLYVVCRPGTAVSGVQGVGPRLGIVTFKSGKMSAVATVYRTTRALTAVRVKLSGSPFVSVEVKAYSNQLRNGMKQGT